MSPLSHEEGLTRLFWRRSSRCALQLRSQPDWSCIPYKSSGRGANTSHLRLTGGFVKVHDQEKHCANWGVARNGACRPVAYQVAENTRWRVRGVSNEAYGEGRGRGVRHRVSRRKGPGSPPRPDIDSSLPRFALHTPLLPSLISIGCFHCYQGVSVIGGRVSR